MKKTAIATVMAMVLLLSSAVMAETAVRYYTVKEGDCLSVICSKLGVDLQEIARINKIKNLNIIYPDQKLVIKKDATQVTKMKEWKTVNRFPYKGTWQWAIKNFSLPAKIKKQVMENIENNKFQWIELESGQILNQIVFGQNQIQWKTLCAWPKANAYSAKDYGTESYRVAQVIMCGNWTWWIGNNKTQRTIEILPVQVRSLESVPKNSIFVSLVNRPEEQKVVVPITRIQPKEKSEEIETVFLNRFDLYIGGGAYESVNQDAKGSYFWGKARYRPFELDLGDNSYTRVGIFAFGALGSGNDRNYDYSWEKWAIGPTAKILGRHWDADLDAGIGKLYNEGGEGLYKSNQVDNIFLLSAHLNYYARRDAKKKWFPKSEFNFELTVPFNSSHEHAWNGEVLTPDAYNNQSVELSLSQSIYDIDLDKHLRLTPGFNFGIGHEFGPDQSYLKFGPVAVLSWHNEDIISISFLNYKEMLNGDGDQWHWLSGSISLGGVYKAYKASRIKEATEKDLKS